MGIGVAAGASVGLKIIGGILGRKKRRKASKRLQNHLMELGEMHLALGDRMAAWYREQNERNWQALQPYRELGTKAAAAIDANMASGRYSAVSPNPPRGGSPSLPVFGVAPGQSGVHPPTSAPVTVPAGAPWPNEVTVPGGAPLPDGSIRDLRTRSD